MEDERFSAAMSKGASTLQLLEKRASEHIKEGCWTPWASLGTSAQGLHLQPL